MWRGLVIALVLAAVYWGSAAAAPKKCHPVKGCATPTITATPTETPMALLNDYDEINTAPATYSQQDSFLMLDGKLFHLTWAAPAAKMIRYNSPLTDLTDQDLFTFPNDGKHSIGQSMAVTPSGKILCTFKLGAGTSPAGQITVDEFDPVAMSTTTVIDTTTNVTARVGSNGPTLKILGDYLYVLTDGTLIISPFSNNSQVFKFRLSDYSQVSFVNLVGLSDGHALETDGTYLYATGYTTLAWFVKINPETMTYEETTFESDQDNPTDDFAILDGYAYVGFETNTGRASISRVLLSNIATKTRIETGIDHLCFGTFVVDRAIWGVWSNTSGSAAGYVARIDPATLDVITQQLQAAAVAPNEVVTEGDQMWIAFWTSPVKVARYTYSQRIRPDGTNAAGNWTAHPSGSLHANTADDDDATSASLAEGSDPSTMILDLETLEEPIEGGGYLLVRSKRIP